MGKDQDVKILPSVMCCRCQDLQAYIAEFEKAAVAGIHFDVMDGHYVPNVMLGVSDFNSIRALTKLPLDVHLMCMEPERFIDYFALEPGDWLSFHPEVCRQPHALLQKARKMGLRTGLAISPAISLSYVEECLDLLDFVLVMAVNPGFAGQKMVASHLGKLRRLAAITSQADHEIDIIVDGNTTIENARKMIANGATGVVTGTSSMLNKGPQSFMDLYGQYVQAVSDKQGR